MIHLLDRNDNIIDDLVIPSTNKGYWASKMTEGIANNLLTFDFTTLQAVAFDNVFKVLAQDQDEQHRLFLVREVIKSQTDFTQDVKTDGEHILLKRAKPILPFTMLNATIEQVAAHVLDGLNYQIGTIEFAGGQDFILQQVVTPLDAIQQIRDTFNCTVKFRVQVSRDGSIQRFVDFLQPKLIFNGKEIVFKKDMTDLIRDEDRSSVVTHMMGVAYDQNKNLVTLASVNNGSDFVVNEQSFQRWNINGQPIYGIHEYQPEQTTIDENNGAIDMQKFLAATQEAARLVNDAVIAYQVGSAALETISGLEHEKMRLYDQVRIKDEKFSPALFLTAQVQQTEMPELDDKSGDFTFQFGDFQIIKSIVEQQLRALQSNVNFNKNTWNSALPAANIAQQIADAAQDSADNAVQLANDAHELIIDLSAIVDGKVSKDDIIIDINASTGTLLIDASKIQFKGAVEVLSDITDDLGDILAGSITLKKDDENFVLVEGGHLHSEGMSAIDNGQSTFTIFDVNDGVYSLQFGVNGSGLSSSTSVKTATEGMVFTDMTEGIASKSVTISPILGGIAFGSDDNFDRSSLVFDPSTDDIVITLPTGGLLRIFEESGGLGNISANEVFATILEGNPDNASNNVFIRPKTGGIALVTRAGTTNQLVEIRAAAFTTSSHKKYKSNIEPWTDDVRDMIKNMDLYTYDFNADLEQGKNFKRYGVVLGDGYGAPDMLVLEDGETLDLQNVAFMGVRGSQIALSEIDDLKTRVEKLEAS